MSFAYEEFSLSGHASVFSATYEEFGGRQLIWGMDTRGLVGSCLWIKELQFGG